MCVLHCVNVIESLQHLTLNTEHMNMNTSSFVCLFAGVPRTTESHCTNRIFISIDFIYKVRVPLIYVVSNLFKFKLLFQVPLSELPLKILTNNTTHSKIPSSENWKICLNNNTIDVYYISYTKSMMTFDDVLHFLNRKCNNISTSATAAAAAALHLNIFQ